MPSSVALSLYLKYNILGPTEMLKVQFIFHLRPWWASSLSDSEARVDIEILDTFANHKLISLLVNFMGNAIMLQQEWFIDANTDHLLSSHLGGDAVCPR